MPLRKTPARKPASKEKAVDSPAAEERIARLRKLAHDLGNSLEAILQAVYLLKRCKIDGDTQRWVHLIDNSSQDAARVNRDMRTLLRELDDRG